jgi:hypothetical protein
LRAFVVGKEVEEFVTKDRDAAGLEADDGNAGFDFGGEFVQDLKQKRAGTVEHAEVVKRAPAAEIGSWDDDPEAGGFEDIDGGLRGRGLEIVIESVGPEENGRSLRG